MQWTERQNRYIKKIGSARHSKHIPAAGTGILRFVLEVNLAVYSGVIATKRFRNFRVLDLNLWPWPWPKCGGESDGPTRNMLVFSWSKSAYLRWSWGQKSISAFHVLDVWLYSVQRAAVTDSPPVNILVFISSKSENFAWRTHERTDIITDRATEQRTDPNLWRRR